MLATTDSPVHQNWKDAIVAARAIDTVFLNQQSRPAFRALRTERTTALAPLGAFDPAEHMANLLDLYFGGDMEAAIPLSGQVVGNIASIKSAKDVVEDTMSEFHSIMAALAEQYVTAV